MAEKYQRYLSSTPSVFRPFDGSDVRASEWLATVPNPIINALLYGFAQGDQEVSEALQETKASLFVKTAENQFLDVLGSSFGVARPPNLGLPDSAFRDLIPPLSLQAKQVRTSFYNAMDAFWGPEFSRANLGTDQVGQFDVYNIRIDDVLTFQVDNRAPQQIVVRDADLQINGAMTINELNALLTVNLTGTTTEIIRDPINDRQFIRILTTTPGLRGSLQYTGLRPSTAGFPPILFPIAKSELIGQAQRTVIYEIRPNELTIEVPAFIPSLSRGLRGSEHLHNGPLLAEIKGRTESVNYRLPVDVVNQNITLPGATISNNFTITNPTLLPWLSINNPSTNIFDLVGTVPGDQDVDVYKPIIRHTKTQSVDFSSTPVRIDGFNTVTKLLIINASSMNQLPEIFTNGDKLITDDSSFSPLTIVDFFRSGGNLHIIVEEDITGLPAMTNITAIQRVEDTDFPIFIRIVNDINNVENRDIWVGSFMYDPNGLESSFTITGQSAQIIGDTTTGGSGLTAGEVHPRITVDSGNNTLPETSGLAVVGFGSESQEQALVIYRGRANQSVIEVDPSFVFTNTHAAGTFINIVSAASPFVPDRQGDAYPVYLTSSTNAREIILEILRTLSAAGVFINFVILAPEYKYLIDNPYLTTDDPPTS